MRHPPPNNTLPSVGRVWGPVPPLRRRELEWERAGAQVLQPCLPLLLRLSCLRCGGPVLLRGAALQLLCGRASAVSGVWGRGTRRCPCPADACSLLPQEPCVPHLHPGRGCCHPPLPPHLSLCPPCRNGRALCLHRAHQAAGQVQAALPGETPAGSGWGCCWGCPCACPPPPPFLMPAPDPCSCQEAESKAWVSYRPTRFYSNLYSAQVSRYNGAGSHWSPPCHGKPRNQWGGGHLVHLHPCLIPQASAWVNVFLWCLLLAWLLIQQRREAPIPLLRHQDPEWSAETEAILGGQPRRS